MSHKLEFVREAFADIQTVDVHIIPGPGCILPRIAASAQTVALRLTPSGPVVTDRGGFAGRFQLEGLAWHDCSVAWERCYFLTRADQRHLIDWSILPQFGDSSVAELRDLYTTMNTTAIWHGDVSVAEAQDFMEQPIPRSKSSPRTKLPRGWRVIEGGGASSNPKGAA